MIQQKQENHNSIEKSSSNLPPPSARYSERGEEAKNVRETHTLVSIAGSDELPEPCEDEQKNKGEGVPTVETEAIHKPTPKEKLKEKILSMKFSNFIEECESQGEEYLYDFQQEMERVKQEDLKQLAKEHGCEVHELPTKLLLPRLVTRGPLPPPTVTPLPQKTKIDSLSFTAQEHYSIMQDLLLLSISQELMFLPRKSGMNGYRDGFNIVLNGQDLGTLSYGSNHNPYQDQKPQIEIGGNGKSDKVNWSLFHYYASLLKSPAVKRVDIALDTFNGEISIESVTEAHANLRFKAKNAPKNPLITPYGGLQPDGTNPGRTVYIGSLQSSKFIRFYEKAYEIFKKELKNEDPNASPTTLGVRKVFEEGGSIGFEGYNNNEPIDIRKWIRAEIELKAGNCEIPLEILIETDKYFIGAYPYCEELLQMCDGKRPKRLMTEDELDWEVRTKNHKAITGSFIEDAIYKGYSDHEIIQMLRSGRGPSQKLIRSGSIKPE